MRRITWGLVVWLAAVAVSNSSATQLIFEPASGVFADFAFLPPGYGDRVAATIQDGFSYSLDCGATPNIVTAFGASDGWPNLDFPSIASVSVEDGLGNVLFSRSDVYIYGATGVPRHTGFNPGVSAAELRIKYDSRTNGHGVTLDSDDVGIDNINFSQSTTLDVPRGGNASSAALSLVVAPNPFRSSVTLAVQVPRQAVMTLDVFDIRGTRIARLAEGPVGPGRHEYSWNGRDASGRRQKPGLYWAQATVEGRRTTRTIVLVK